MRRSSTDETPYRRSPSLDSKADSPPFTSGFHRFSGEFEYKRPPFAFGFHTTKGPQTSKGRYAQGKKYVVFYLDLSFIFLLELRRCRMAEGCMMALRYGMVFFNLLFWFSINGCRNALKNPFSYHYSCPPHHSSDLSVRRAAVDEEEVQLHRLLLLQQRWSRCQCTLRIFIAPIQQIRHVNL
ncbi:hypothetical protein F2P81_004233 [Scophthalmus maximus]|uniref:Uncharacterized protein n=1 Tax=Scophthalmus maximus TaxID=52904 RepID=A0A6A4T5N7_SCOMX|nr:hypothetical protein F2P81_004233 [Scophthalmus maximus]